MTQKVYMKLTYPPIFPRKAESKGVASKYCAAWLGSLHAKRWMKHCSWFWSQTQPSEKKACNVSAILVLHLYYSCYTNKLFRPCPEQMPEFSGFIGQCFLSRMLSTLWSSLHPKNVSSSISNSRLEVINLSNDFYVPFDLHVTQAECVMSLFRCSWAPCHAIWKALFGIHTHLYPWYQLQRWTVKRSYSLALLWKNHMDKHMASKTKWSVSLGCFFFFFSNNITNVLWHDG